MIVSMASSFCVLKEGYHGSLSDGDKVKQELKKISKN